MPQVSPDILVWARETAGLSREEAVRRLGIKAARGDDPVGRLTALEEGRVEPSRSLLAKMAKQYRRSLLAFYLPERPPKADRGQDFRTLPEGRSGADEALLDALVRDIGTRQSLVRAVIENDPDAQRLDFVGSMTMADGVDAVAASIRERVTFDPTAFRNAPSVEQAFAVVREHVEGVGVFVLLIGNLGSHHTALEVETFRGFALADPFAPFIVINDQDAKAAWSFTLLHELAHLWLGTTGISGTSSDNRVERFCNEVASCLLVPADELDQLNASGDRLALIASIDAFAVDRNVSSASIAYRLFQSGRISADTWRDLSRDLRDRWLKSRADQRQRNREAEGGPNYYVVRRHRVGPALINFVRRNMAGGELTTVKAGRVLGVRPKNVPALVQRGPQ